MKNEIQAILGPRGCSSGGEAGSGEEGIVPAVLAASAALGGTKPPVKQEDTTGDDST